MICLKNVIFELESTCAISISKRVQPMDNGNRTSECKTSDCENRINACDSAESDNGNSERTSGCRTSRVTRDSGTGSISSDESITCRASDSRDIEKGTSGISTSKIRTNTTGTSVSRTSTSGTSEYEPGDREAHSSGIGNSRTSEGRAASSGSGVNGGMNTILLKGQMRYMDDLNGMAFLCKPL